MYDRASYVPPFQIGAPLDGGCVGQVVETAGKTDHQVGDYVSGRQGWREYYVSSGTELTKVEPTWVPLQAY